MIVKKLAILVAFGTMLSCQTSKPFKVAKNSVKPGSTVYYGKEAIKLHSGKIELGSNLFTMIENATGEKLEHKVTLVSIVPSVDTKVCEAQTHALGENQTIKKDITRITISRDLPMAQERFAKAAHLENIRYISDYKGGKFGKTSGLMMEADQLLTRVVIVTDKTGVITYMQVVPDISQLPDMTKAISIANNLVLENKI